MKKLMIGFMILSLFISSLMANDVETLLKDNKCMRCHNIVGMKSAPPFSGIVSMNSGWFGVSKSSLKDSIKNGSQGKYPMFSNTKMPAFTKLSDEDLDMIVSWIVKQGSRGMKNGMMHHSNMRHMNN